MKVFFTRALNRLRRLPVVMPPRASRGVDRNEPRVAEPELEVHRPVNLLPERPPGRIVQVVVPDDTDVRDPERFDEAQIGLVPLERPGSCEVSEIRKEERLTLAHLLYELREDCLRGRVDPRTRVARKGKPQRLVEGRLLDPFRHLRVAHAELLPRAEGCHTSGSRTCRGASFSTSEAMESFLARPVGQDHSANGHRNDHRSSCGEPKRVPGGE